MDSPYSDDLIEWATAANPDMGVRQEQDGAWRLSSWEMADVLRHEPGMWTLTHSDMGMPERLLMSAPDLTDVERYLTIRFGTSVRRLRKLAFLYGAADPSMLSPQCRVVESSDQLELHDSAGRLRGVFPGPLELGHPLIEFSWVLDATLDDLRASFLDRMGATLFGSLWIGPSGLYPHRPEGQSLCVDRIGNMEGTLFFMQERGAAAPWSQRSLPVTGLGKDYSEYIVGDWPDGWRLTTAVTAPWFGQPGGAKRAWFRNPADVKLNVRQLVNMGWLIPADEYLPAGTIVSARDADDTVMIVNKVGPLLKREPR